MDRYPAEVTHPGVFIREELEARGWTEGQFQQMLRLQPLRLHRVLWGKADVTPVLARRLAYAFGTSDKMWMNLQHAWDEAAPMRSGTVSEPRRYTPCPYCGIAVLPGDVHLCPEIPGAYATSRLKEIRELEEATAAIRAVSKRLALLEAVADAARPIQAMYARRFGCTVLEMKREIIKNPEFFDEQKLWVALADALEAVS